MFPCSHVPCRTSKPRARKIYFFRCLLIVLDMFIIFEALPKNCKKFSKKCFSKISLSYFSLFVPFWREWNRRIIFASFADGQDFLFPEDRSCLSAENPDGCKITVSEIDIAFIFCCIQLPFFKN